MRSHLTPAGVNRPGTAGNVVPFDANEWIPTEVSGEVMQALNKQSAIQQIARREQLMGDAEFLPRDLGTTIDSPRLVGFFPDVTGGDEVLIRPSVFGTQIAFERFDLDDSKPNPIPPKVNAWVRTLALTIDRVCLSTNPNKSITAPASGKVGGEWTSIETGSTATVVKPETHVPACSLFAALAIGRSEDKHFAPTENGGTVPAVPSGARPTDWTRPSGWPAAAPEYQFTPGYTHGETRDITTRMPVHLCTTSQFFSGNNNFGGSNGYNMLSATKGYMEDSYFYNPGMMMWLVPYSVRDIIRRITDRDGNPLLATAPGGQMDMIMGDPVVYTPGGDIARPATVTENPVANVVYSASSTPGTAAPTPASGAATHAFNPLTNGGYKSPVTYAAASAGTAANPAPGQKVGVMIAYGDPSSLIFGARSGPEYMAHRYDAESKFNKDWLKMQIRFGFTIGFPQCWSALVIVPGAATAVSANSIKVGDIVSPVTGRTVTDDG